MTPRQKRQAMARKIAGKLPAKHTPKGETGVKDSDLRAIQRLLEK